MHANQAGCMQISLVHANQAGCPCEHPACPADPILPIPVLPIPILPT
jgi:hypothetical protein